MLGDADERVRRAMRSESGGRMMVRLHEGRRAGTTEPSGTRAKTQHACSIPQERTSSELEGRCPLRMDGRRRIQTGPWPSRAALLRDVESVEAGV